MMMSARSFSRVIVFRIKMISCCSCCGVIKKISLDGYLFTDYLLYTALCMIMIILFIVCYNNVLRFDLFALAYNQFFAF